MQEFQRNLRTVAPDPGDACPRPALPLERLCDAASHPSLGHTHCLQVTGEANFRRLEPLWRAFHDESAARSPFATWEWVWDWWQTFGRAPRDGAGASEPLVIAVLDAHRRLIGLLPFHHPIGPLPARALRTLNAFGLLEDGAETMAEEAVLLLRPGAERRAIESALWFLLRKERQTLWDCLKLRIQHAGGAPLSAPASAWPALLARLQHRDTCQIMEMTLPPSWDALRSSVSRSMRDNIKYYPRLLARHGHSWEVEVVTNPEDIAREAGILVRLHRERGRTRTRYPGDGHLPADVHRRFFQDHLARRAQEGTASIAVMRVDGRPVASQALFQARDRVHFYFGGFDPAWAAYSPMTVLQTEIFRDLIARGVTQVNLLAPDQPWKARWGARPTDYLQKLAYVRLRPGALMRAYHDRVKARGRRDALEA